MYYPITRPRTSTEFLIYRVLKPLLEGFYGAGHASAGVTGLSTDWFLAEGATGMFDEFILLANPNAEAAAVTLTYLLPGGGTLERGLTVPGKSRSTIYVNGERAPGVSLANGTVSATIQSNQPIIAERAMWWPSGGFTTTWLEAHNSPGVTSTGTLWGLADGEQGGTRSVDTYVLVANTSPFQGNVQVSLLFEDGTTVACGGGVVPATSRTTYYMGDCAEARGRRFGVLVESVATDDGTAQIVVERAMYSNALGRWWSAGTDAVATRIR
jgi:hypothetical protein